MMTIFDKPFATLTLDQERGILFQKWNGYVKVEDFKQAIDTSVQCFKTHALAYIISDTLEQAVLAKEGSDYAASVMPELIANGMKKIAFIIPKSSFTKLSIDNFSKNAEKSIIGHFTTIEEAIDWLKA